MKRLVIVWMSLMTSLTCLGKIHDESSVLVLLEQYGISPQAQEIAQYISENKRSNSNIIIVFIDSYLQDLSKTEYEAASSYLFKSFMNKAKLSGVNHFDKIIAIGSVPSRLLESNPGFQTLAERYFLNIRWKPETGELVRADFEPRSSLDQVLSLFPQTKEIVLVTTNSNVGQQNILTEFYKVQKDYADIEIKQIEQTLEPEEFVKKIQSENVNPAILITEYFQNSKNWSANLEWLKEQKVYPTFTILGYKIKEVFGGVVVVPLKLAETTLLIANGEILSKETNYAIQKQVNFLRMSDFGISKNNLPKGTIIVNRPLDFSREEILGFIAIGLFIVVSSLLIFLYRASKFNLALKKLAGEKVQILEKQTKIFAIIAHELRTPVSILKNLIELEDLKVLKNGQIIESTVNHLIGVLDDMKAISSPETIMNSNKTQSSLIEIIESGSKLVESISKEHDLDVIIISSKDPIPEIFVNTQLLKQIIMNLITNAAYHSGGNRLEITPRIISETDNEFRISILFSDDGVGISGNLKEKLFDPFERGNVNENGSGLGLFLSKNYSQKYLDGDLVLNESAEGTCFELFITVYKKDPNTPSTFIQEDVVLEGLNILNVEDNEIISITNEIMLKREGCKVTSVKNGKQALLAMEEDHFDLVLTDIYMPEMDGNEFTRLSREKGYTNLILGITASNLGAETDMLIAAGADDCLVKPISIVNIKMAIEKYNRSKSE